MEKLPSCANNCKSKVKDDYYMDRMKEILTGFPNTGPPNYPVKLTEHVYIGSQKHADDVEMLKRYGITHVSTAPDSDGTTSPDLRTRRSLESKDS